MICFHWSHFRDIAELSGKLEACLDREKNLKIRVEELETENKRLQGWLLAKADIPKHTVEDSPVVVGNGPARPMPKTMREFVHKAEQQLLEEQAPNA